MKPGADLTGLLPLIPPPAPAAPWWQAYWPWLAAAALILALVGWWLSPRQRHKRRLARLARQATKGDCRGTATALDCWLRQQLHTNRLGPNTPSGVDEDSWQRFTAELHTARFAPSEPTAQQVLALIAQARRLTGVRGD